MYLKSYSLSLTRSLARYIIIFAVSLAFSINNTSILETIQCLEVIFTELLFKVTHYYRQDNFLYFISTILLLLWLVYFKFPDYLVSISIVFFFVQILPETNNKYEISMFEKIIGFLCYGYLTKLAHQPIENNELNETAYISLLGIFYTLNICIFILVAKRTLKHRCPPKLLVHTILLYFIAVILPPFYSIFKMNPIYWLFLFLNHDHRCITLLYWCCLLSSGILSIQYIAKQKIYPLIIIRKLFHLLAITLFLPVIMFDSMMMVLSFSISISLLILIELERYLNIVNCASYIDSYFGLFLGESPDKKLTLHHIYLLLGCALPLFVNNCLLMTSQVQVNPYLGLITVGVGDASAAVIGTLYGKNSILWPGSSRTLVGSAAMVASMLLSMLLLGITDWTRTLVVILLTTVLEGTTEEVDNLILPLGAVIIDFVCQLV